MAAYQLCVYLYCGQFVYVPFIHSFFYLLVDSVFFNLFINVRRVTPIGWSHTLFRHVWWNKFAHSLQVCLLSQMGQGPVLVGRLVDGERYFWGCRFSLGQLRSSPTFCLLKILSTMLIFYFFYFTCMACLLSNCKSLLFPEVFIAHTRAHLPFLVQFCTHRGAWQNLRWSTFCKNCGIQCHCATVFYVSGRPVGNVCYASQATGSPLTGPKSASVEGNGKQTQINQRFVCLCVY